MATGREMQFPRRHRGSTLVIWFLLEKLLLAFRSSEVPILWQLKGKIPRGRFPWAKAGKDLLLHRTSEKVCGPGGEASLGSIYPKNRARAFQAWPPPTRVSRQGLRESLQAIIPVLGRPALRNENTVNTAGLPSEPGRADESRRHYTSSVWPFLTDDGMCSRTAQIGRNWLPWEGVLFSSHFGFGFVFCFWTSRSWVSTARESEGRRWPRSWRSSDPR